MNPPRPARIGVVTISDRASRGEYQDLGGPAILAVLTDFLDSPWEAVERMVPDERPQIEACLIATAALTDLIITTGGTGPTQRDVTPEATAAVCDKMLPGFGEAMRAHSLRYVPTAILSRQTAGIRNQTLIVNCPGKPRSIRECLEIVFPAIPYCVELLSGVVMTTPAGILTAYRPT